MEADLIGDEIKSVDPNLYSRDYFLNDLDGYETFVKFNGALVDPRLKLCLQIAGIKKGMNVLDIGCGRGELVLQSAMRGANVKGIDYAFSAIELAQEIIPDELKGNVALDVLDVKALDEPKNFYDVIFLTDVVEHLYDYELKVLFEKCAKMLTLEGIIIINTAPNTWLYDYVYPVFRGINRQHGGLAKNLRSDFERQIHVNEQSPGRLAGLLKKVGLVYEPHFSDQNFIPDLVPESDFWRRIAGSKIFEKFFARTMTFVAGRSYSSCKAAVDRLETLTLQNEKCFVSGWYDFEGEEAGRWSGKASVMRFLADRGEVKLLICFNRPENLYPDTLKVECGDFEKSYDVREDGVMEIGIPVKKGEFNEVKLMVGKSWCPKETGFNEDERDLGFRVVDVGRE
ncbi:class I SAM-dependent methyltransferase [Patescibacteria group bacterium]|nr:class I SAM-dependent methyltransferase [Patescibacteria group bacterium]